MLGELETQTRSVILFTNNALLLIIKENLIIFSYLILEKNLDVLRAFSTDRSAITFSFSSKSEGTRGKGVEA